MEREWPKVGERGRNGEQEQGGDSAKEFLVNGKLNFIRCVVRESVDLPVVVIRIY